MSLIFITGIAGSGKSSVCNELKMLGYEAYDVDAPEIGGPFNKQSGEMVVMPDAKKRTQVWLDAHSWRTIPGVIAKLKRDASEKMCSYVAWPKMIQYGLRVRSTLFA